MHKTILITGSTDGIGLATAKALALKGHTIILHGRSESKLESAHQELLKTLPAEQLDCVQADLSNLDAVSQLAQDVLSRHSKIDVLINNAGIFKTSQPVLANGMDVRFVVNTVAPYLLTRLLLKILAPDGRVVNLSSAAQAPVELQMLRGEVTTDDAFSAYAQSKLALTIWSQEMASSLVDSKQVMVSVNPGSLLASKMVKEGFGVAGSDLSIGVDILVRAALSDEFQNASGKYFDNDAKAFNAPHEDAANSVKNRDLIRVLEELTAQYF